MSNLARQLSQSHDISAKVAEVLQTRTTRAVERFGQRVSKPMSDSYPG